MNNYGKEFIKLKKQKIVLGRKTINNEDKKFCFLYMDDALLDNCLDIAKAKAEKTMAQSQSGDVRTMKEKISKQLQGIVAETLVQLYLENLSYIDEVYRFDIERENFNYSKKEFDVDFIVDKERYTCEIRSTIDHKNIGIEKWYKDNSLIGPYTNNFKKTEELNDFYFSVVFFTTNKHKPNKYNSLTFEEDLRNHNIIPAILAVASKDEMKTKHFFSSLNQKDTKYRLVKLSNLSDLSKDIIKENC